MTDTVERSGLDAAVAEAVRYIPADLRRRDLGGGRVLRHAEVSEYDDVGDVLAAAFTTGCWVTELYEAGLHRIAERARTSNVWVVADAEGILGGVLTPQPQFHTGERFTFNILGVGPRGRGLGLGRALTDHAVGLARALGYRELEIHSGPTMTAAHQVYYRYGFRRRLDQETSVVDGGQRLLVFTLQVPDPVTDPPAVPRLTPPPAFSLGADSKEVAVSLVDLRPAGQVDAAGQFVPEEPTRPGRIDLPLDAAGLKLVLGVHSPRGWPALLAVRLGGLGDRVEVEYRDDGAGSPVLLDADGALVSDDWRELSRWFHRAAGEAGERFYPAALATVVDEVNRVLRADLVDGLERALFSTDETVREAAARLLYARLGVLDVHLAGHRYLVADALTDADLTLFGVLVGFDLGQRAQLGWGPAGVVDYPHLWAYARELYQTPGFITEAERVALGHAPSVDGRYAEPWGSPRLIEQRLDLRQAWYDPHGRG